MFWGAFLYNWKSPCYIQKPETTAEKEALKRKLKVINDAIKPELYKAWELNTSMRQLGLCNKLGRKPQFRIIEANSAFKRTSEKGGIDWYRYLTTILLPILISFSVKC